MSELSVRGLTVTPDGADAPVLRSVDLLVPSGQLVALVGPSGAGKTTLLRAIAGLTKVQEGEISIEGRSQLALPPHNRPIAMVFQEPRLLPNLSVEDNAALPLRARGAGRGERREAARARLAEVGLGEMAERSVHGLSGGEAQRVSLARALCAEPELLLLDEPLAALDPERRESLRGLIAEVSSARGLTSLLVTHDRGEAAELGDSVALLLGGGIVQHGTPEEMFERPTSLEAASFFGVSNVLRVGPKGSASRAIRPEHVVVGEGPLSGRVIESTYRGTTVRVILEWEGQRVEADVTTGAVPPAGSMVPFALPEDRLWKIPEA